MTTNACLCCPAEGANVVSRMPTAAPPDANDCDETPRVTMTNHSESVLRRPGRLNHQHVAERARKLRYDGESPVEREHQNAELHAAWRDWLAEERARRGSPSWQPLSR